MTQVRAKSIFLRAVEDLAPSDWSNYLDEACGDDQGLRRNVERLLDAHRGETDLADEAREAHQEFFQTVGQAVAEPVGSQIGPYKLREQIGEGGMGIVYVAEQNEPVRRRVALKIIRPGMATKDVMSRFQAERQALAMMDHPNISKVHDGGATESGHPYFVMELVQGLPLTEYCDVQRLSTEDRLKLFVTVCNAVQHAHQKGVIHRDLKPSNVLVPEIDGHAVPKVIDFGVAKAIGQKLTAQTVYTRFSQLVGTPLYMSPEQAGLGIVDVDTRSDVYSLGVILYELLTGQTPFDRDHLKQAGEDEMRRIIREEEPRRPSVMISTLKADLMSTVSLRRNSDPRHLRDAFRGELDWIVMKALEKDRERRYESASALADDVERFLSNQPITARPPSTFYRTKKFAQRNQARLVPATIAAAILLVGLSFSAVAVLRARFEKEEILNDTARRFAVSQVRQAATAWGEFDYGALHEFLQNAAPKDGSPDFRGWEWYFLQDQSQRLFAETPQGDVIQAAWRPHHDHIAVCVPRGPNLAIEFWKPERQTKLRELIVLPNTWPPILRWSDDGARLAIGTWEGLVTVVDATTGNVVFQRNPFEHDATFDSLGAIDLSPNGDRLVAASSFGHVQLWNVAEKTPPVTLNIPDTGTSADDKGEKGITSIAFSPDANRLGIRMKFGRVVTMDLQTHETVDYERTANSRLALEWNPSGQVFVSTDASHVSVYEPGHKEAIYKFRQLGASSVWWFDNNVFASGGSDHTIRLWDMSKRSEIRAVQVDRRAIEICGASPDRRYLAAKTKAVGKLRIIRLDELLRSRHATLSPPTISNDGGKNMVKWSPNGRFIASGHNDGRVHVGHYGSTVRIFDVQQRKLLVEYSMSPNPKIDWSSNSEWLQAVDSMGRIHTLSVAEPHVKLTRFLPEESDYFKLITFSTFKNSAVHRQKSLIALDKKFQETEDNLPKEVWIYDYDALKVLDTISTEGGLKQWSPDGTRLCIVRGPDVLVYHLDGRLDRKEKVLEASCSAIAWNQDSSELALGAHDGALHILDVGSLEARTLQGRHRAPVEGLVWSPDGSRVASTALDGTLRISDSVASDEMAVLSLPVSIDAIHQLDWSPSGQQLAVAIQSGEIYLLDAPAMPFNENASWRPQVEVDGDTSPIHSAIAAFRTSSSPFAVDDFDDGNYEGWTHVIPETYQSTGRASYDAASGAYQLATVDQVADHVSDGGFVAALWDKSADPMYSNGLVRAKVRIDSEGCIASIAFRISRGRRESGYLFIANCDAQYKGGDFQFHRIKDGKSVRTAKLGTTELKVRVGEEWWIEAGGIGDQLSMKVWREGDPEPAEPQLIVMDDTYSKGLFGVETNIIGSFPSRAQINATFDDISFTPLGTVSESLRQ